MLWQVTSDTMTVRLKGNLWHKVLFKFIFYFYSDYMNTRDCWWLLASWYQNFPAAIVFFFLVEKDLSLHFYTLVKSRSKSFFLSIFFLASRCTDKFKTYIAGQHWFMTVNGKNYSCKCHGAWGGHRTCALKDT